MAFQSHYGRAQAFIARECKAVDKSQAVHFDNKIDGELDKLLANKLMH